MLDTARLVAFVPSTDLDRSEQFYGGVLGLTLVERSPYALVVRSGETVLRVTQVGELRPQPFTVLGFAVADVRRSLAELAARGVLPEQFGGLDQDAHGVWTAPGGDLIAWFKDPDGNLLSFSQQV